MKKIYLLLFCYSIYFVADAQINLTKQWDHRYGGVSGDYCTAFRRTTDGGFILAGKTDSDSSGNKTSNMLPNSTFDYWVVKLNYSGNLMWEKDIQAADNDNLWSINLTADGGYIIGGTSNSPIGGSKSEISRGGTDYWIVKLDGQGNVMWDKTLGGAGDDDLRYVFQTSDGGYMVGGTSRSVVSGEKSQVKFGLSDYWVVKTDSMGNKLWDKVYGGLSSEQYRVTVQTSDGGYLHAGASSSDTGGTKTDHSQGGSDFWIVKTDSLGAIQWDSAYGGPADDNLSAMIQTTGGGFIMGGVTNSGIGGDKSQPLNGAYDVWVVKVTSTGTIQWERTYGGPGWEDEFCSFYQTMDGGYLCGATSYSSIGLDKTENNLGVEQPWIFKIDMNGVKQWDKTVFTLGHNEAGFTEEMEKNCYVVVCGDNGLTGGDKSEDAWGGFSEDFWIVKYCDDQNVGNNELTLNSDNIMVYPNPFTDNLKVRLAVSHTSIAVAILYDALGKEVLSKEFEGGTTLNTSILPKGIYFLEIKVDGVSGRKKIISFSN
jgi:hypothetical protein